MKIEPSKNQLTGVSATMQHVCGHQMSYWFAAEEFAQHAQEDYESKPCLSCRNRDAAEAFKRSRAKKD